MFVSVFLMLNEVSDDRCLFQVDFEPFLFFKFGLVVVDLFFVPQEVTLKLLTLSLEGLLLLEDDCF